MHTHAPSSAEGRGPLVAWAFYDWANSAFPTVISTFVFATYFSQGIAETPERGTVLWGHAQSAAGLLIAILSPVLGAIADRSGRRKPWLIGLTWACAIASGLLWFAGPEAGFILYALVLVVVATVCFEIAIVFYNAMLPELCPAHLMGRVSGWAWGLGYAGGLACLVIALLALVQADTPPFGLDPERAEDVRATALLVAVWMLVFSLPTFLVIREPAARRMSMLTAAREGLGNLWTSLKAIRRHRNMVRFLIARMLYIDGLNTLFAFGGIYAAGTFGMAFSDVIVFGIAMNVSAGLGAAAFGFIDDWIGSKKTVIIGLIGMICLGAALVLIEDVLLFWIFALLLGLFFGPVQAASRTFMARIAPENMRAESFGLYALSGKITAFLGPFVLAVATDLSGSQRIGMATILIFLILGLIGLWRFVHDVGPGAAEPAA